MKSILSHSPAWRTMFIGLMLRQLWVQIARKSFFPWALEVRSFTQAPVLWMVWWRLW